LQGAIAEIAKVDHKTIAADRKKGEQLGSVPQLEKRVGLDGKARSEPKAKGQVPLDDPARPRNRDGGPVSEERAQAARYVMEKIIRPSLPKIIGESLPRGAAKQAEAADPLDSLKTAFLALDGRARSRFRD